MDEKYKHLKLSRLPGEYKFLGFSEIKSFTEAVAAIIHNHEATHYFLLNSPNDHSMIVPSTLPITADKEQSGWVVVTTVGAMPFGSVQGLIAMIAEALRQHKLGVCVISSFDCDFFLLRSIQFTNAQKILLQAGWTFV